MIKFRTTIKLVFPLLITTLLLVSCKTTSVFKKADAVKSIIKIKDGQFIKNDKPYYFIGTNYWYGAILGSKGELGNRKRLVKELDFMKSVGIDNLRVLAGAEGPNGEPFRVTPALQIAPGKYDKNLLDGLDFFLAELKKRDMTAVLFFTNNWEWSGGFSQYLNWNGFGDIPYPKVKKEYPKNFNNYNAQFHECLDCISMLNKHIEFIVTRTNKYTGLAYKDDPAIMSWEIANEPRAMLKEKTSAMENWMFDTAAMIKKLDPNHLITSGSEGIDLASFERIHSNINYDYLTFHIWPKNWSWIKSDSIAETLDDAILKTNKYIEKRVLIAEKINKPIVFEEFGLPRDSHDFTPGSPTIQRDKYYKNVFNQILKSAKNKGVLAGCNFWAFGGNVKPIKGQLMWKIGDPPTGDPPQEEQGLNSVFKKDSTMGLIYDFNNKIRELIKTKN